MKREVTQPEGNCYDKYKSDNIIVKKLMRGFFSSLDDMLETAELKVKGCCLEAGCGEGEITSYMERWLYGRGIATKISAFDISENLINNNAKHYPQISFFIHNIYEPIQKKDLPENQRFDLIVCSEVLEHLEKPKKALNNLRQYGGKFIISVPHEPIWCCMNMARGRYLRNLGNTPGHIQHFTKRKFIKMIESCGLMVKKIRTPLPWLMAYCESHKD